jgi:hypothetical protein
MRFAPDIAIPSRGSFWASSKSASSNGNTPKRVRSAADMNMKQLL